MKTTPKYYAKFPHCKDAEHGTITAYDKDDCFSMTARKKPAFTMAEVLITLMILGVIAIITIPGIIKNVEQHILIGQIKEAYSITQQIVQRATVDYGHPTGWDKSLASAAWAEQYVVPYINVSHICGCSIDSKMVKGHNCFIPDEYNGHWKYLNGTSNQGVQAGYGSTYMYNMKLANGMDLAIFHYAATGTNPSLQPVYFIFDVNGSQTGPSTEGIDIFSFRLDVHDKGIVKTASQYTSTYGEQNSISVLLSCSYGACCTKSDSGRSCARVLELNGWKFPANYPW